MNRGMICSLVMLAAGMASAADFGGWRKTMPIAFSGYTRSETLTNYPALVVLSTNINGFSYADCLSTNADLRFTDSTQTNELNYEVERWDTNGSSYVWVKVPLLTSNASIQAFWGMSGTNAPAYTTNGATWSGGFGGVWHLSEPGVAHNDSAGANNLATNSAAGVGYVATGRVAGAASFIGGSSSITALDHPDLDGMGSALTLEAWCYLSDPVAQNNAVLCKRNSGTDCSYALFSSNTRDVRCDITDNTSGRLASTRALITNRWTHIAVVFQGAGVRRFYFDGQDAGQPTETKASVANTTAPFNIGMFGASGLGWVGMLDEVRVQSAARSSNWVWACWLNQASNSAFNTFGLVRPPSFPEVSNSGAQNLSTTSAEVMGRLITNGTSATTVTLYWSTTDGRTNASDWTAGGSVSNLGTQAAGAAFTNALTGLTPDTTYFWNYRAVNDSGTVWAATAGSPSFRTRADFSTWQKHMTITFAGYARAEALTNFPALVVLSTNINGFRYTDFLSTNADLRFTDATQTNELNYEIDAWATNGSSYVWVQVPLLTNSAGIHAFWGKSVQAAPACTTNGSVWTAGYAGVWHLQETGTASRVDATRKGNTGTAQGDASFTAAGAVAGAAQFDGSGDYINVGNVAAISGVGQLTVSGWVYLNTLGTSADADDAGIFARGTSGTDPVTLWYNVNVVAGAGEHVYTFNSGDSNFSSNQVNGSTGKAVAGKWQYVVGTMNGATRRLYVDGALDASTNAAPATVVPASADIARIGGWSFTTNFDFNGRLDEVRLSTVERSSNWVWACYMNQASNSAFNTCALVVDASLPQISNIGMQNLSNTSVDVAATLSSSGGSAATMYLYWSTTDGRTNASDWTAGGGSVSNLGVKADGATFTNTLAGLTPNTTYYWNHSAVNASGTVWAATAGSPSFKTYGPPAVNNGAGATDVYQPFGATLNGNLTNGTAAHVYILLGTNDGVWTVTNDLSTLNEGPFSKPVSGLTAGTPYYYTCYATNAYGSALATPSAVFTTRQGSVYYWVGAANANWSAAGNWAATSGGAGGAGVPGAMDDVIFDAGGVNNAVVDAAFAGSVYAVTVGAGYTGTNTQNRNLSVAQDYRLLRGAWRFTAGTAAALSVGNDMVVSNATVFCERVSTAGQGTGRVFTVGGSLTLATNGAFNADGLGFDTQAGPGSGSYQVGGTHGGEGGHSYTTPNPYAKPPYGSITAPISLGSGGGIDNGAQHQGGGAVRLVVTGSVTVAAGGRISANGNGSAGVYSAAGAGGSIMIQCASLSGNGTVYANGGASAMAGGGGGRIAVWLTSGSDVGGVRLLACSGSSWPYGAAGTVYLQTSGQTEGAGTLVLDNLNRRAYIGDYRRGYGSRATTLLRSGEDWSGFAAVIITNQADVGLYTNVNISAVKFVGTGATGSYITVRAPAAGLTFPANWVISNFTLVADAPVTLPGDVTVATNSAITHSPHEGTTVVYRLDLTVTNLTVYGAVHADNRGFPGAKQGENQGRGPAPGNYKLGAAHGGDRGVATGNTDPIVGLPYGSITNPTTLGSGGNILPGGGAIWLTVPGTLTVGASAAISACGSVPCEYGGSGAGGSILITAGALAGSGTVKANGGIGGSASANGDGLAGGSGGRVSVWSTSGDFGNVAFQAYGGYEKGTSVPDGAAGTVYLRGMEDYGRLIVDNTNYDAVARTLITSNVTGAVVGDVVMRNLGNVTLGTNATLTVCGSWTNQTTSTFIAQTNSTVVFAGTNAATVYGNRTYYNLVATNDARTLRFEAGKTNTVLGALSLDKVTLLSTVDGSWWYLTQATNAPQDIRRVTVKDSNAGGGQEMRAVRGDSLGHNVNWWFPARGTSFMFK